MRYIHTFELTMALRKKEFNMLLDKWIGNHNRRKYTNHAYSEEGINITVERGKEKGFIFLRMRIAPSRIIEKGNYLGLYEHTGEKHKKVWETIERVWNEAGETVPYERFYLSRVDFTIDIKMDSEEKVREYIRLLGKSILLPNTKMESVSEMRHWNKEMDENGELGLNWKKFELTRSEDFQIYSKLYQMQNENLISQEEADQLGYHILRMEMQIRRRKLKEIFDMLIPGNTDPSEQFRTLLTHEEFFVLDRLRSYYKPGRFKKKRDLLKKIEDAIVIREKRKSQIIDLIESANRNITLGRCLEIDYRNRYEKKRRKSLECLSEMGYSPVCISSDYVGEDELPDIFELTQE